MKGLDYALLAGGAVVGAYARYHATQSPLVWHTVPVNVFLINAAGAFVLGVFVVLSQRWNLDTRYALAVAVGFCGSLTTMSAFALESVDLLDHSRYLAWGVHILANVGLSVGALLGGKFLARAVLTN